MKNTQVLRIEGIAQSIFEIYFNFESTLIIASTPRVMQVLSVQSSGAMILPVLNP